MLDRLRQCTFTLLYDSFNWHTAEAVLRHSVELFTISDSLVGLKILM